MHNTRMVLRKDNVRLGVPCVLACRCTGQPQSGTKGLREACRQPRAHKVSRLFKPLCSLPRRICTCRLVSQCLLALCGGPTVSEHWAEDARGRQAAQGDDWVREGLGVLGRGSCEQGTDYGDRIAVTRYMFGFIAQMRCSLHMKSGSMAESGCLSMPVYIYI